MKKLIFILCFLFSVCFYAQESSLEEKFTLPVEVKETSGLLFFNSKAITHNDSGDGPNLYEIDTVNGAVTRTISVTNATHIDWEDISQDETYIYIADIGNNNGDRQDLKIYRILKSDYISSNNVSAEEISFSYEDQIDFSSQPINTNFDAEAIAVYQGNILIFTKNWIDFKTNAYVIPKTVGNHIAQKVSTFDSQGLITGVSYNPNDDSFLFCGYNASFTPFLLYISQNRPPTLDVFGGSTTKIDLIDDIFLEAGSQVEAITFFEGSRYYISREFFSIVISGTTFEFPQKLYEFNNSLFQLLSTNDYTLSKTTQIVPNPVGDYLNIIQIENTLPIKSIRLFTMNGKEVLTMKLNSEIDLKTISKGVYLLQIQFENGKSVVKKIIKK